MCGALTDRARARDVDERAEARPLVFNSRAVMVVTSLLPHLLCEPRQQHAGTRLLHAHRRGDEEEPEPAVPDLLAAWRNAVKSELRTLRGSTGSTAIPCVGSAQSTLRRCSRCPDRRGPL